MPPVKVMLRTARTSLEDLESFAITVAERLYAEIMVQGLIPQVRNAGTTTVSMVNRKPFLHGNMCTGKQRTGRIAGLFLRSCRLLHVYGHCIMAHGINWRYLFEDD